LRQSTYTPSAPSSSGAVDVRGMVVSMIWPFQSGSPDWSSLDCLAISG